MEPLEPNDEIIADGYQQLSSMVNTGQALRIRIKNDGHQHAYINLLDPSWKKDLITIDIPVMSDPTNGKLEKYGDLCESLKGKKSAIGGVWIWCPALALHLDLFTVHVYDTTPSKEDPYAFCNLIILPARVDAYQMRNDIIWWPEPKFALLESTRMSFILPAHSTMVIDLYIDKTEDVDKEIYWATK